MSLVSLSGRAFLPRKLLTPKKPRLSPATSPREPQTSGGPQIISVRCGALVLPVLTQYLSLCHSWRAAAAHPPRAGLGVPGGCCCLMPSLRPSVCPRDAGAVARGLPPGSSLLPRFPCPRADITAQRRSPAVTQGDGGWEDTGGCLTPLEAPPAPAAPRARHSPVPTLPSPRETEARLGGREGNTLQTPLQPLSASLPAETPAHTALPNALGRARGCPGHAEPRAPIPAGSTAGWHKAVGS